MVMRTKVLVFVGLFLVSVLGISGEFPAPTIPLISYSLNAKVFDYGQNIVSIEIDTKGQGKNIQNKQKDKDTTPRIRRSFINEQHTIDEDKNSEGFPQRVKSKSNLLERAVSG